MFPNFDNDIFTTYDPDRSRYLVNQDAANAGQNILSNLFNRNAAHYASVNYASGEAPHFDPNGLPLLGGTEYLLDQVDAPIQDPTTVRVPAPQKERPKPADPPSLELLDHFAIDLNQRDRSLALLRQNEDDSNFANREIRFFQPNTELHNYNDYTSKEILRLKTPFSFQDPLTLEIKQRALETPDEYPHEWENEIEQRRTPQAPSFPEPVTDGINAISKQNKVSDPEISESGQRVYNAQNVDFLRVKENLQQSNDMYNKEYLKRDKESLKEKYSLRQRKKNEFKAVKDRNLIFFKKNLGISHDAKKMEILESKPELAVNQTRNFNNPILSNYVTKKNSNCSEKRVDKFLKDPLDVKPLPQRYWCRGQNAWDRMNKNTLKRRAEKYEKFDTRFFKRQAEVFDWQVPENRQRGRRLRAKGLKVLGSENTSLGLPYLIEDIAKNRSFANVNEERTYQSNRDVVERYPKKNRGAKIEQVEYESRSYSQPQDIVLSRTNPSFARQRDDVRSSSVHQTVRKNVDPTKIEERNFKNINTNLNSYFQDKNQRRAVYDTPFFGDKQFLQNQIVSF